MQKTFEPRGQPLALSPEAFGIALFAEPVERVVRMHGPCAVVEVVGPLVHHVELENDSYDAIKARVSEALASEAACVLLSIDSPGGLVAGAFDCAAELREMASAAGKPLYCYVDACCASAAYALATAADRIYIPPAGIAGSIGVIEVSVECSAAEQAMGTRFSIFKSGARKDDGNPHVKLGDEAANAIQARVDYLADLFFGLVSARRGISVDAVRGMQAGLFVGQQAVDAGLADEIATLDQVLAKLASGPAAGESAATGETHMNVDEAIKALRAVAENEEAPAEDREKARKALAAYDSEDKPEEEAKAESGDEDEEKPEASAHAQVNSSNYDVVGRAEAAARLAILATRPDLDERQTAALAAVPVAELSKVLGAIPRKPAPVDAARAELAAKLPAVKANEPRVDQETSPDLLKLDQRMGIIKPQARAAVERENGKVVFWPIVPGERE